MLSHTTFNNFFFSKGTTSKRGVKDLPVSANMIDDYSYVEEENGVPRHSMMDDKKSYSTILPPSDYVKRFSVQYIEEYIASSYIC